MRIRDISATVSSEVWNLLLIPYIGRYKIGLIKGLDVEKHISEIKNIHENNVIPYENTDDAYCRKLHSLYEGWTTLRDVVRESWNVRLDVYRGAFAAVRDLIGGILGLEWSLKEMQFYPLLQSVGIVPGWMQKDMDRLEQSVTLLLTDPGKAVEAIGQNTFDTADEEGVAYSVGYVIVDIALEILVDKGLKRMKAAKMADDVPMITLDALQCAEPEYIIAYADAGEDFVKYAEQVSGEVRAVVGAELRPGNIWGM